jgi:hypothetical protein
MTESQQPASDEPHSEGKGKRRINWFLILLIVAPFALLLGRAISTGGLIGYMRTADVGDLLLLSPLYGVILIYLLFYMARYQAPASVQVLFISFSFLFIFGQAMHLTANAINTFATEVRDYKAILPADLYTLIFDLDERLSHWILLAASIGLIGSWFIYDRMLISPPIFPKNRILIVLVGVIWGIVMAISVIEARMAVLGAFVLLLLAVLWIWYWRRSNQRIGVFAVERPYTGFVAVMIIACLGFFLVWGLIYGGFPQPSELGI